MGRRGGLAHGLDDVDTEGELGDEMAVHDVDVEGVDLRGLEAFHLRFKLAEIGGKQAGGDADGTHAAHLARKSEGREFFGDVGNGTYGTDRTYGTDGTVKTRYFFFSISSIS